MMSYTRTLAAVAACALTVALATPAHAQVNSAESSATLTALLPESLSVTLLPPATSFVLSSGSATNTAVLTLAATTTWALALTRSDLSLYGYFSSANSALAHTLLINTIDIPSSRVEVSVNGGALLAFDQTVPFGAAGAGRQLWTQSVTPLTSSGLRTDTLSLNVNLGNYPIPADVYVGTLRIRAQATP